MMDDETLSPEAIARQAIERCHREIAAAWAQIDTAKETLHRGPQPAWLRELGAAGGAELAAQARRETSVHRRRRARSRSSPRTPAQPPPRKERRRHK
jgi:hypothetical protein